jgi:hypothetical protein
MVMAYFKILFMHWNTGQSQKTLISIAGKSTNVQTEYKSKALKIDSDLAFL